MSVWGRPEVVSHRGSIPAHQFVGHLHSSAVPIVIAPKRVSDNDHNWRTWQTYKLLNVLRGNNGCRAIDPFRAVSNNMSARGCGTLYKVDIAICACSSASTPAMSRETSFALDQFRK
jgi:hypothetical protein